MFKDRPQRSRRLSASGIRLTRGTELTTYWWPQRSRRLSASGIWSPPHTRRTEKRCLKEADAFQRLVCAQPRQNPRRLHWASKKQTPFSVWYPMGRQSRRRRTTGLKEADAFQRLVFIPLAIAGAPFALASKKQTPFSVWYRTARRIAHHRGAGLKEADAFQRLVSRPAASEFAIRRRPQRSRRLSASGMSRTPADVSSDCGPQRSRRLSASGMGVGELERRAR